MSSLFSHNRQYEVKIQDDGNLVVYSASGRVIWAAGADSSPEPLPPAPVVPPPTDTWPRVGASYYTSLTDPRIDPPTFAARLADLGVTFTRAWLFDAWAIGASAGTGCYDGYLPWLRGADGRFDLWWMDAAYLDRLRAYVEAMSAQGILVQLCGMELYTWSDRKQGLLWVPPSAHQPWRSNSQGIDYHDDHAFERIGQAMGLDAFLSACYQRVVTTLEGLPYSVELGNELPEKTLHARLAVAWREAGYRGSISVNRQEDTPGQYRNMRIGEMGGYDRIAFHGKRSLAYLDEEFPREPELRTFQLFWASGPDPSRVILSSDGCRASTDVARAYDYGQLLEVAQDARRRGASYEHQLALKLRGFTHGRIDLDDLQYDAAFLRALTR